jgi:hypothetical protein
MAYDPALVSRIDALLADQPGLRQQRMFGGVCFLVRGHMVCGVLNDRLIARVGPEASDRLLEAPHVRPMDFTGRPMRGLLVVLPPGIATRPALARWIGHTLCYVRALPPKSATPRPRRRLAN